MQWFILAIFPILNYTPVLTSMVITPAHFKKIKKIKKTHNTFQENQENQENSSFLISLILWIFWISLIFLNIFLMAIDLF